MELQKPSARILVVWRVRLAIGATFPAFLSACFITTGSLIWWIFTGLWISAFFYLYIFYYPIKLQKMAYSVNETCLLLHCGVIYTRLKAIRFSSIQYTLLFSTPLSRLVGIYTLLIFCAGSVSWQPGLTSTAAETLRTQLGARMEEHSND